MEEKEIYKGIFVKNVKYILHLKEEKRSVKSYLKLMFERNRV